MTQIQSLFRGLLILCFSLLSIRLCAQKTPDSIDIFIQKKMTELNIPGVQLATIRNGKLEKLSNYGFASLEYKVPTTASSIFSINSITKAFVGIAIMQLQEEGKLNIDTPFCKYLPDVPNEWRSITIKQLLSNISGLPNNIDQAERVLGDGSENSNWQLVKKLPMEFAPGERFSYNQTGYLILGRIITQLAGKHFTDFIKERQFAPSNMTSTYFGDCNDIIPNNAGSYSTIVNIEGKWINDGILHNSFATFPLFFRASTGIYTTAEDLAKWLISLQTGKLLKSRQSIDQMFETAKLNNGQIGGFNKLTNGYALGWPTVVRDEHPAVAPVGGMRAALFLYPKDDLSVIVLTNLQGSNPEWFIDEIAGFYIPDMKAENGFGLSPNLKLLRQELLKKNFKDIKTVFKAIKNKHSSFQLEEAEVNSWGYQLIGENKKSEALQVFELNTYLFPNSWNVYDSYGETLASLGYRKEAVVNYKKSLQLNPENTGAAKFLEGEVVK